MFFAIVFAILLLIAGGLLIASRRYAIGLFNVLWAAVFVISCREFSMDIYGHTLLLLCLMVIMMNVGYYRATKKPQKHIVRHVFEAQERVLNEKVLEIILIISCVVFAWYAIRTVAIFGFHLGEIRGYNNAANEASAFSSRVDTILFYGVATPLIYTAILVFAYSFSQNIKIQPKFYGMALVAILLQMITTGGGRSIILRGGLFFAAAAVMRFPEWKSIDKKKRKIYLCVGASMLLLLEIVTFIRNSGDISFVGQAVDYIRGSVGHMQYRLTRPMGPQYYGGFVAFGGFFYYPIKILNMLTGLELQTSNELLAYLQEYRGVTLYDQTINYNALVPNAFYFFYDNGYVGVIVLSALHGFLMERAERTCRQPTFLGFVMWATCIYMIAYSPLDGVLWTFRHPTTIICCVVLNQYLYRPVIKNRRRKDDVIDQCDCSDL